MKPEDYQINILPSGFMVMDCVRCDVELINGKSSFDLDEAVNLATLHHEEAHTG